MNKLIFIFADGDNTLINIKDELVLKADTISMMNLNGHTVSFVASKREYTVKFEEAKDAKEVFKTIWSVLTKKVPRFMNEEVK
jgi:hypothetical protein